MSGTPPVAGVGGGGGVSGGGAGVAAAVSAASADHFCLRWNNYQTNMTAVFDQLLQEEVFVDVTLSCEGGAQLRAHKVVLAACSPYFQSVLQNNPCKHPIVILPRDVAFADLRAIIEFVYRGEIDVAQEQINSLLAAADTLKIKGLCEVGDDPTHVPPGFTATPSSGISRHQGSSMLSSHGNSTGGSGNTTGENTSRHGPGTGRGRYQSSRGRFNTSYRPRGRPPLYGRHRYERASAIQARREIENQAIAANKRIKTEDSDSDIGSHGASSHSNGPRGKQTNHSHSSSSYVMSHHNSGGALGSAVGHMPPNAHSHTHHGTPAALPPSAHALPLPLPELGPSIGLPQTEETASASQYDPSGYSTYPKTEVGHHHLGEVGDGHRMTVTPELLGLMPSNAASHYSSDTESIGGTPGGRKLWTDEDMDKALESLRTNSMSLSRAATVYGIPATTLWQRAHRIGIETPKKEGPNKTWSEHDLNGALGELRSGRMSANRASKEFGIPNSTLYKIARKEGIKLSSPFSAIQPSWNPDELTKALEAIRTGMSVQKAAQEFGIPTGTLYGRCRREGIELSKYQGVPWSEEDMKDALEAVRVGEMSINQAAIHFNLPYSSLYGRFKRGKYDDGLSHQDFLEQEMTIEHYSASTDQEQTPPPSAQGQLTPSSGGQAQLTSGGGGPPSHNDSY